MRKLTTEERDVLLRKIREHPAFHGNGPADEEYWLDYMQLTLAEFGTYEFMVECFADWCERDTKMLAAYIIVSEKDRLAWDALHVLVPRLRTGGKVVPPLLVEWWLDVTTGILKKPKKGGKPVQRNSNEQATIAAAVNGIREVSGIPYYSDERNDAEPHTACHVVAERLGMPYTTVRSIWLKMQPLVKRAQENGLVPPPRPKKRRRR